MKKYILTILFLCALIRAFGQNEAHQKYTLNHSPGSTIIEISIQFDPISSTDVKLVLPRSGPGTYDLTNYLAFVDEVKGFTTTDRLLKGSVGQGSYFVFNEENSLVHKISYEVDLEKMESELLGGFVSSKSRKNYLGLLGYSVFGFIEGFESHPIQLEVQTSQDWPIFSTLRPTTNRKYGQDIYDVEDFSMLADAQFLLGSAVQLFQVHDAQIPLFVAVYTESKVDIKEIGRRGNLALNGLADYFGYIPMPHYTLCYEFLIPFSDRHDYGFSMEHMNSMTASFDTSRAVVKYDPDAQMGSIVHHIGHSWLPLRSYGTGYRPFEWQTAPLVETIWLNEGFIWYVAYYHVLGNKSILNRFNNIVKNAPDYIQQKSLKDLSLLGSTQYSLDFRIGMNLFSRGALLAHDLDVFIQKETNGRKTFKDVMLGLLKWTEVNQRAFEYDEIASIISTAVDVDISAIWKKWQEPPEMSKD